LRSAAAADANVVEEPSGLISPFIHTLDTATIDSLIHERERLAKKTVADKLAHDA